MLPQYHLTALMRLYFEEFHESSRFVDCVQEREEGKRSLKNHWSDYTYDLLKYTLNREEKLTLNIWCTVRRLQHQCIRPMIVH